MDAHMQQTSCAELCCDRIKLSMCESLLSLKAILTCWTCP
jgi:hypothetical protein